VAQYTENGGSIGASEDGQMGGQIGGSIGGSIQMTSGRKEILLLIENDTQISKRQLAQILKINHSAVDKHIQFLKSKGILERIGETLVPYVLNWCTFWHNIFHSLL